MKILSRIVGLLIVVLSIQCFAAPQYALSATEIDQVNKVIATIRQYYIKPVSNQELVDKAIAGMLEQLDPHSSYLDEESLQHLKLVTGGHFAGVGIQIVPIDGGLKVIAPIDESPAKEAGIKAGDVVYRIDDQLVRNLSPNKAIAKIRGEKGTKVTLYVARKGENKPLKFEITRAIVEVSGVKNKLYDKYYGYIRIALFNKPTKKEVMLAVMHLNEETNDRLRGLIIDLRSNPGGTLLPSIQVADMFLDAGKLVNNLIVYTVGYPNQQRRNFSATKGELLPKIPIVVLVNEGTASAAEILAGALQDHQRAIILGTKSFGKGSVQRILPITKTSAIKLTTSLYYTPKGRSIQAEGIKPDVVVADLQIPKGKTEALLFDPIYESNLVNHLANGNGKNGQNDKAPTVTSKRLLHTDYQLYEALNLVKGLSAITKR